MPSPDPTAPFGNEPAAELRRAPGAGPLAPCPRAVGSGSTSRSSSPGGWSRRPTRCRRSIPAASRARSARPVAGGWRARRGDDRPARVGCPGAVGPSGHGRRARAGGGPARRAGGGLAPLIAIEAGKPLAEADADVCEAIDFWTYYAACRGSPGAHPARPVPGRAEQTCTTAARGVGVVIAPWNFPLAIPAGMVGGALVMGNPVVFKPAEQTPGVALRLVQVLHEAGVPPAALPLLTGIGEDVGPLLVEPTRSSFPWRSPGRGPWASTSSRRPRSSSRGSGR